MDLGRIDRCMEVLPLLYVENLTRLGTARRVSAWLGRAGLGMAGPGVARQGMAGQGFLEDESGSIPI